MEGPSQQRRVLIADDDTEILQFMKLSFQRYGYQVYTATNGRDTIQLVRTEDPDLLVMDINMPLMDGIQVTRVVRADDRTAHLPIILVTAQTQVEDKLRAFDSGADDYVTKPFEVRELIARANALVSRGGRVRKVAAVDGKVVVLFGPKGGVGTSGLSANLAVAVHEQGRSVGLIDLDTEFGGLSTLLDLIPKKEGTLAHLASQGANEQDWLSLDNAFVEHKTGVRLLVGAVGPEQAELVTSELVGVSFSLCHRYLHLTVVDVHSSFRELNLTALDLADRILLVLGPDIASLKVTVDALRVFHKLGYERKKVALLVNYYHPFPSLSLEQIKSVTDMEIMGTVPYGGETYHKCAARGTPIVSTQPRHPCSVAIRGIAERILSAVETIDTGSSEAATDVSKPRTGISLPFGRGKG